MMEYVGVAERIAVYEWESAGLPQKTGSTRRHSVSRLQKPEVHGRQIGPDNDILKNDPYHDLLRLDFWV